MSSSGGSSSAAAAPTTTAGGGGAAARVVALNVKFVAKSAETKSKMLDLLRKDQIGTYNEDGALQFTIGRDISNPLTIHLHEQYRSQEAVDKHMQEPHFKSFIEYTESSNEVLAEPPVVTVYRCNHVPVRREPHKVEAYSLNVESCIRPEVRNEFVELMEKHQKNTLEEPKCLQFDWGEHVDEPNSFYIHEEYYGEEGYKEHEATPHFANFMEFNSAKNPYNKPQVVSFFKTII